MKFAVSVTHDLNYTNPGYMMLRWYATLEEAKAACKSLVMRHTVDKANIGRTINLLSWVTVNDETKDTFHIEFQFQIEASDIGNAGGDWTEFDKIGLTPLRRDL